MSNTNLLQQAEQAFALGKHQQGLESLRAHNKTNQATALSWHRQAVIEEQIGENKLAGKAHQHSIVMQPNNGIGYLYGGYWLESQQQVEAAAAAYSLAFELSPELYNTSDVNRQSRIESGANLLRSFLTEHHKKIAASSTKSGRIKDAIWQQTDINSPYKKQSFAPDLFFIPEVSQATFYNSNDFAWANELEKNTDAIKQELNNALTKAEVQTYLRPYLPAGFQAAPELENLVGSNQWRALDLYKDGQLNSNLAQYFQVTLGLMDQIPTYNLNGHPFEVFFSVLQPHQEISPHFGQSNHALTAHLPLEIPANCHMKVGSDQQQWQEGTLMLFDDSHLHSAHNNSDQQRIVLIFSVWHPDLSIDEQQAVQTSFKHRQSWLENRYQTILNGFNLLT